jgi:hypothetical protein
MQYVSEAGPITCISKWKPCTLEVFAQNLHNYHCIYCDEHGSEAFITKSYKLESRGGFVTIIYARIKHRGIGTPVLMTMTHPTGKTMTFETTEELPQRR